MPNIVIVGTPGSKQFIDEIQQIVTGLGVEPEDGVITINKSTCFDMTSNHKLCPYLIVRDSVVRRGMTIAIALNDALKIDVEVEILHDFLPAPK